MKFKFIILICLIGFFALGSFNQVRADYVPEIYAQNLQISGISNNQITGQFTVWNAEDSYFPDLNYAIQLFKGTQFNSLQLIDSQVPSELLSVSPKGTITKSFIYAYPKSIASGSYTLRIQLITAKGSQLGWDDQIVSLKGENNFLYIVNSSSRVLVGKEQASSGEGVNVSPANSVVASMKVENSGNTITVVPQIKIFQRQFNMALVKQYNDSPITFAKGETKDISLTMPKLDTPESYLAEVKFFQNNQQVSGIQYFRWVVEGDSGKILYITTGKDIYAAGENMEVIVYSVGPADFSTIKTGKLEVVVYDQNKNMVAKVSKNIVLNYNLMPNVITIPIKNDLINPTVDATITSAGKTLDNYKIALATSPIEVKNLQQEDKTRSIIFYLILALVIIILIVGFLIFKFRKK